MKAEHEQLGVLHGSFCRTRRENTWGICHVDRQVRVGQSSETGSRWLTGAAATCADKHTAGLLKPRYQHECNGVAHAELGGTRRVRLSYSN